MVIEVKECPISPLTPVKLGENQNIITEIEPPIINPILKRKEHHQKVEKGKREKY